MVTALLITLIGMSLVFGAILLLWALMMILVSTSRASESKEIEEDEKGYHQAVVTAAAVAVALALAEEEHAHTPKEFPLPPTALVSAWQAVMRSNTFSKRNQIR